MEIWKEPGGTELVCHTIVRAPGAPCLFHLHDNYEFCQPVEISCDFLVDGRVYHAEPGDIVVVEPQVVHRFLPSQPDTQVRVIQFPLRILPQSGASAGTLQTFIPRSAMEAVPGLFPAVTTLMGLMEQEPRVYTGEKNELFRSLTVSLYLLLLKHFPESVPQSRRKDADLFSRAAEYINANFNREELTVERVAKELFLSREKLSSLFLQYAGVSCKQYINALRVDYVNRLLLDGADITGAAMKAGFGSIRTFNSVYKTVTGMTPTEYLKRMDNG